MDWKILHRYWFGNPQETADYVATRGKLWFGKSERTDETIRREFSPWLARPADVIAKWHYPDQAYLTSILLFDQVPRNSFRGTPQSFAYDSIALDLAEKGVGSIDQSLSSFERLFFYLPFEHSERLDMQKKSVALYEQLAKETDNPNLGAFVQEVCTYAHKHLEIIERFGRFPHRNAILGRASTPEETAFLKEPGSSF